MEKSEEGKGRAAASAAAASSSSSFASEAGESMKRRMANGEWRMEIGTEE